MHLVAGDIAIVSLNHDTNKIFAFVCLVDIPAGEVIKFTDNGWTAAGAFRSGEGIITWTAPAGGITAGTVITINTTSTTPTVTGGGTATETGDVNFSTSGDQLLAWQGADATPTFLYGVNNEGANVWQADATSSNTSALPTGLTDGSNAVALTELDNYRYSGPTTGSRAELLAAISNRTNWTGDNDANQTAPAGFTVNSGGGGGLTFAVSDATVTEGDSGTVAMTFTVTRSSGTGAATVNFATSDGSATAGADYAAASGTLSFADGVVSQTVTVTVNGDTTVEPNETLTLTLSAPSTGTISDATGTGTITNDDAAASTVSVSDASVTEGNAGTATLTFTVTRAGSSVGAASVDYATSNGTATAGSDYVASSGTVSFADGVTSQTVTVTVNGDTDAEAGETVALTLSNAVNTAIADGTATGTITNDDVAPPPAPGAQPFINEFHYDNAGADTGEFIEIAGSAGLDLTGYSLVLYNGNGGVTYGTRALSGVIPNQQNGLGVLSFAYPVDGIQNGAPDGIALVGPGGVVLEFISYEGVMTATNGPASGMTSIDVGVEEGGGGGTSIARVGAGGGPSNFTWTVATDDTPGAINTGQTFSPTVSVSNATVTEGNAGSATLTFTVSRTNGSGAATVDFATANGPAAGGQGADSADYTATSGTVSFADGVTSQTVTVQVTGDVRPELDEVVLLNLSNPSSGLVISDGQGAGSIVNDDGAPSTVTIGDVTVTEGQAGTVTATFTVTRAGGTEAFSVDFATANGSATAGSDYIANSGTLTFAAGVNVQTVTVTVNGDTAAEAPETFTVNLSNATNNTVITDGVGVGTIATDDPLGIFQIQGEDHVSAFVGQTVQTSGIVTAVDNNGYYLQDAAGDGNIRTSDGIFVFTSTPPTGVVVGSAVTVVGVVQEDRFEAAQLSTTRIVLSSGGQTVTGTGTIVSTVIGTLPGQRAAPTENIDNDGLTSFDPESDGIDFWESLEGMQVTLADARAVSNTASGGTYAISNSGAGASGANARGGITIGDDGPDADAIEDLNPERILIFDDSTVSGSYAPSHTVGDRLGDVRGVVSYFGGDYEIVVNAPVTVVQDVTLTAEVTELVLGDTAATGPADRITIGSYNVENLDPGDGQKITELGIDIVQNLGTPDVIGLVEVQDNNGAGGGGGTAGNLSAQALINAIVAAGGPTYLYIEVAPADGTTGGEPGGNIRNGFLYNPDRVDYVDGSAVAVQDAAFTGSRRPLSAQFNFNDETLTVLSVHSTSRIGSDPLFGQQQPPSNAGDSARIAQSTAMLAYINALRAVDPDAHIVLSGDFNAFEFEQALELLEAGPNGLNNLYDLLAPEDRYTFLFEGNSQGLDHVLVSDSLLTGARFDAVHTNSDVPTAQRSTDHDGLVALLTVVGAGNNQLLGTAGADTLAGLGGNDTYTVNNAGDVVVEALNAGTDVVLASVSYTLTDNVENLTLTGTAADGTGNALNNTVTGNASANTLDGGDGADILIGRGGNDILLGGAGIDTASFALAAAGVQVRLHTSEVRNDGDGGVDVISGVENVIGSSFDDLIIGAGTDNVLNGGLGRDTLIGLGGNDTLIGGTGAANEVYGGLGDDLFIVELAGDTLIENSDQGIDTVQTNLGTFTLEANFENLTSSGTGPFTGNGNALANTLRGSNGRDQLNAGDGDDTLIGRGGIDHLNGGNGIDTLDYSAAVSAVSVRLGVQLTLDDGDGAYDVLSSVENVTGSAFADELHGDGAANVIRGGLGADILLGFGGNDTLDGGAGADNTLQGGLGDDLYIITASDTVNEFAGEGTDTVQTSRAYHVLAANIENLTYTGPSSFVGIGNALANSLTGGAANDALTGGQGNDTLTGGLGQDVAVLSGLLAEYTVENLGAGSYRVTDTVAGRDGVDTLFGVEGLLFNNGATLVLGGPGAPLAPVDKSAGEALVLPGLIDDGFVDMKGADVPQVLPGLLGELDLGGVRGAASNTGLLVRDGHALTLLDGFADDHGNAHGSHHDDWYSL